MENRKTPIASFYCNLTIFKDYYKNLWFPYTMPISDIYGLKAAMDNIAADKDLIKRHARIANATRKAIEAFGLKLHLESGFSDTVTVFDVPEGMTADDILERMREKTWNHAGRFLSENWKEKSFESGIWVQVQM